MLIDRFNDNYKDEIEVIPINLPFSKFSTNERKELLARSLRSKSDLIDVFAVDLIWSARFAKWVHPLDNLLDSSDLNNLLSYSLESCYYKGNLVAVPLYIDVGLMYYRKDLIKKYPDSQQAKQAQLLLGHAFHKLKQNREAVAAYKKITDDKTNSYPVATITEALFYLGESLFELAEYEDSARAYLKIGLVYSEFEPAYALNALVRAWICYEKLQQWYDAQTWYKRALQDYSNHSKKTSFIFSMSNIVDALVYRIFWSINLISRSWRSNRICSSSSSPVYWR